ncbi:MAG TPA: phosphoglycolate phosphatase [Firmicutes bacterium]|nr:phosphoglycolate phosphatase [Bacillota bacterium]
MSYKILATDIDGTITDEKGRIHLKAVEWIRKLEDKGVKVILVSGRPLPFLESLSLFVGTSGPLIAENGAVVNIDGQTKLLGDPQLAKDALFVLKSAGIPIALDIDNAYRQVDISIRLDADPKEISTVIQERNLPVSILVTNVMLHLVDKRVSKGGTLSKVLKDMGIMPSEVVVSGDSYNDLPLFEIGAFNLAVANAAEALQSKANRVAKGMYGEGFAELIQEIFEKFNS